MIELLFEEELLSLALFCLLYSTYFLHISYDIYLLNYYYYFLCGPLCIIVYCVLYIECVK